MVRKIYYFEYKKKRNKAKKDFEKGFFTLLVNAAFGKDLESVRNRLRLELGKNDIKKFIKQQSKLTFNGIHKSHENFYSYIFKKK